MLETPEAVDNVEAIAAVPGYDVLLAGANDLCMEMGIPGQLDHPRIGEAFARIVATCRANGKHAGLGGVYDPPLMQRCMARRSWGRRASPTPAARPGVGGVPRLCRAIRVL